MAKASPKNQGAAGRSGKTNRQNPKISKIREKLALRSDQSINFYEDIVETIRDPLLVLDSDLRVLDANRRFYNEFKVTAQKTVGNLIYDLGNRQWDIPKLRLLLEEILPEKTDLTIIRSTMYFQPLEKGSCF